LFDEEAATEEWQRYEEHLESCPVCQERLDRGDVCREAWRRLGRRDGDPTLRPADPRLVEIVERLHEEQGRGPSGVRGGEGWYFLRPTDRPDLLGTLGRYEVQVVLGQGGMGIVFRAFDPALDRLVAIKVLAPRVAVSAAARRRFAREAQAAAAVRHEYVVAVHGVHEADGLPYLVMQYVAGESLQERLNRTGPLDVAEVVRIGYETASGLAAAHAEGLVHRDIKPANILLAAGGLASSPDAKPPAAVVRISDFGLARAVDAVGLTQSGVVAGTPEYMSPEQACAESVDQRSDLFSLGSVLYACCTGRPPFRGGTAVEVLRRVRDAAPPPLRQQNPDVPAWLEALITRLLARDPADRFQSAAEVAELLDRGRAPLREPAPVPPAPSLRRPFGAGWRLGFLAGLALTVLLLVLGAARWLLLLEAPAAGPAASFERTYDFRGSRPLPPEIQPSGALQDAVVRPEEEGVRITLPANREDPNVRAGLEMPTNIRGDFEITAGYEILRADRPTKGYGVGFELFAHIVKNPQQGLGMYRMVRTQDGEIYLVSHNYFDAAGKPKYDQTAVPTTIRAGRLRIARTGEEATASAAEGNDGPFRELAHYKIGPDDITVLFLMAFTGHQQEPADLRVTSLQIRSTASPVANAAVVEGAAPPPARSSLLLLGGALLLLLAAGAAGVAWYALRGRGTARAAPPLAVTCPGCGKNLQARAELAGKRVKCPHCHQPVHLPGPAPT
jgi:hypothetical protein